MQVTRHHSKKSALSILPEDMLKNAEFTKIWRHIFLAKDEGWLLL